MTTIVTRTTVGSNTGKGSPLTHTEVDTNFVNLNTAKLETAAIPLGTLGAPSISFLSYSTTGIYSPAGDELGVSMLGSDKIRIKSTGEIIINATASRTTLSTTPRLQIEGSASSNQCSMSLTGAGAGGTLFPRLHLSKARSSVNAIVLEDDILGFISFNGGDGSSLVNAGFIKAEVDGTPSAGIVPGRLVFATVDTAGSSGERMIIKNNGNVSIDGTTFNVDAVNNRVGIGTTNPSQLLDIVGATSGTVKIDGLTRGGVASFYLNGTQTSIVGNTGAILGDSTAGLGLLAETGNEIRLYTNGSATPRVIVDTSGRLLVGTTTTSATCNTLLQATGGTGGTLILSRNAATPADGEDLGFISFNDSAHIYNNAVIRAQRDGGTWTATTSKPSRLVFSTTPDNGSSPSPRMTITNAGDVYIGHTGALFNNTGTTIGAAGEVQFSASANYPLLLNRNTSDGTLLEIRRGWTSVGSISVTTTATAYNTSSDYRLKENIAPVTDGIARLQQLKPSRFNFIADLDRTVDGFIAHEVQTVVPEAIAGEKDAVDDEGNPVYQGIDQSKLVPLLTAALQEAIAKIETLEQRLTAAGID